MVRQVVWHLLDECVSSNDQTVLITTHCWSEAAQASTLGFMRHGQILLEQSASKLFEEFSTSDIEHIFHQLCLKHSATKNSDKNSEFADSKVQPHPIEATEGSRNDKDVFDWHAFKALLLKDSIHMRMHASFLAFQVVLPIFVTLLFYGCIGRRRLLLSPSMYCLTGEQTNKFIAHWGHSFKTLICGHLLMRFCFRAAAKPID